MGRNHLNIIHSKCEQDFDDTFYFRQHVSICQGPHTNGDNSSPKRSSRTGAVPPTHPIAVALARPTQLPCPGFSFKELLGKDYESLLRHEKKRVDRALEAARLVWLDPKSKSSVISTSCLKESPPHQETAKSCCHCSRISELPGFKDILRPQKYQPNVTRYSPFKSIDAKKIDAGENQNNTNVSQSRSLPYPTFVDNAPLG